MRGRAVRTRCHDVAVITAEHTEWEALGGPPLDMHEVKSTPTGREAPGEALSGCDRWPKSMWLLSSTGVKVPGRCGASIQCDYCAKLAAVEYSESLTLDALKGNAPEVFMVLTQGDHQRDGKALTKSLRKVVDAVRLRWPDAEYALLVEFTTGESAQSGGRRFAHFNVMWKNIAADELDELRLVVLKVWCRREKADVRAQKFQSVYAVGGLMRYVALHFLKHSQAPPKHWRGRRFRSSQGYFTVGRAAQKRESVNALRAKRHLRTATEDGYAGLVALEVAALRSIQAKATTWDLVHLRRSEVYGVEVEVIEVRQPRPQLLTAHRGEQRYVVHRVTGEVWA